MANVSLWGANYSDVPAITVPQTGGGTVTFTDVTDTTATATDVATGKYFYTADGTKTAGTSSGGGGSSSWTKVAETSYQVSATNTSSATIEMWVTGHSELWTSSKWVYVRVRDTAGKRDGYFYGSDQFFYNINPINGKTASFSGYILNMCTKYSSNEFAVTNSINAGTYGVYTDKLYSDGRLRMRNRYNSTYSGTINGTYKVEVYLLDPAGGVPIFE